MLQHIKRNQGRRVRGEMICTHARLENQKKFRKKKKGRGERKRRAEEKATKAASKVSKQERGARNQSRGVRRIEFITSANWSFERLLKQLIPVLIVL